MSEGSAYERAGSRRWWQTGRARIVLPVILLALAAAVAWWFYDRMNYVRTSDARIQSTMIMIGATVSGTVKRLDLVAGDTVKKGQVLAAIDDREARARLAATRSRVTALKAQLAVLDDRIGLEEDRAGVRQRRAESRLQAARAAEAVKASRNEQADSEFRRVDPMARDGMVSAQRQDEAKHALVAARAELRQAHAERQEAEAGLAEARVEARQPQIMRSRRAVLTAQLDEARAQQQLQRIDLDDRTLRSPIDGVVDRVLVDPGEYVSEGRYMILLHAPDDVWVEARIKETRMARVSVGQAVSVSVDAFPDRVYRGRVKRVVRAATSQFSLLPDPNPSGNFTKITQRLPVRIALEDEDQRLAPGMMVEVAIDVRD